MTFGAQRVASRWRPSRGLRGALVVAFAGLALSCGGEDRIDPADAYASHGRWERIPEHRRAAAPNAEQQRMIEELEAIGYASGSAPPDQRGGVVRRDPERSTAGLTFLTSGHGPEALLLAADGAVLHRWRKPFESVWPHARVPYGGADTTFWRRARLLPDGDVVAIFEGLGVLRIDRDSNLVWANLNGAHHDLDVDAKGRVWVLTRKAHLVPAVNPNRPILEDFVSQLDEAGQEVRRVSVLEAFERSRWAPMARAHYPRGGDLFHINTLTILEGRIADRMPAFRAGNILVSSFRMHSVGVLDMQRRAMVWVKEGSFRHQHDAQILDNGHMLLFDNQGRGEASTILELDPSDGRVAWEYRGDEEDQFYSATCGTVQRLPGGNTLISESDPGRAFEVTPEGEIVWEYVNPQRAGEDGEFIATIFEAWRLPADFPTDWLGGSGQAAGSKGAR